MSSEQKALWNAKAKTYGRFKQNDSDTLELLSFFKEHGVDFSGKNIIDIGCGNGRFSLELAKSAKNVLCFDIAQNMLDDLQADAKNLGIDNIKIKCADFDENYGDLGRFDIVFAAMTPALNNEANFAHALELYNECFCYVGWGRVRKEPLTQEVLKAHGAALFLPKGLPDALIWLKNAGKSPLAQQYFLREFKHKYSLEEAIERTMMQCKMHQINIDEKICAKIVAQHLNTHNLVEFSNVREIGVMLIK